MSEMCADLPDIGIRTTSPARTSGNEDNVFRIDGKLALYMHACQPMSKFVRQIPMQLLRISTLNHPGAVQHPRSQVMGTKLWIPWRVLKAAITSKQTQVCHL